MKSIQGIFVTMTLAAVLLLAVVLGGVSVFALVSKATADASVAMNLTCANEAQSIDEILEGVEDAVGIGSEYAAERIEQDGDVAGAEAWLLDAERVFSSIAARTNGAVFYYLRLGSGADATGFFYARKNTEDDFRSLPLSGLNGMLPGESEADAVGWSNEKLESGSPLWLNPYAPENLDFMTTSYVHPVMVDGAYMGVVGMGIDFQSVIDQVESISAYESGYGFLTDALGNVMYHPSIPYGTNLSEDDQDVPEVDEAIAAGTTVDDVVVYQYYGADKRMAFHVLQNEMRLVLSVNADEIYADRDRLAVILELVTILVAIVVVAAAMIISRRALKPLHDLTDAAEEVAAGNLQVSMPTPVYRELVSLVGAYDKTVEELRDQIAFIDALAHRDALTGFLNKGSFEEMSAKLNERIAEDGECRFALAMLDVNNLKPVNDTQGHEAGDELLKRAVAAIAETFGDVPRYRVGGDEFVVLMTDDVVHVDFVEGDGVVVACGVAEFRPGEDADVASVLARADALMYEHKRAMKG